MDKSQKIKLTTPEIIKHMKTKGITFDLIEDDLCPEYFLSYNTYYYKFSAYRHNFNKRPDGTYINLDFKHLQELSTIDMYLRSILLQMCLDIEHSLKVTLLRKIEDNEKEDGYNIIKVFINKLDSRPGKNFGDFRQELNRRTSKQTGNYNKNILNNYKYRELPVWVFVELITFSNLCYLIETYGNIYKDNKIFDNKVLNNVRDLRNACAHNNCIIYNLKSSNNFYSKPAPQIYTFVQEKLENTDHSINQIRNRLKNTVVFDLCCLLYTYEDIISSFDIKLKTYLKLDDLIKNRMLKNSDIFISNEPISKTYNFFKDIVDNLR